MIWAVDQLQNGEPSTAAKFIRFPQEAAGADIGSRHRVHQWAMETLINKLMTVPKARLLIHKANRALDFTSFNAVAAVVNALNFGRC